ncbi:protein masquerade-like [Diachasma alloeum]|uniref:protein masquerade-like n=1 Tax=Diachasma alloeum TaxID=454923 RepID=UPI0010FB2312|nr:protein masquerade-like [Diachasma alloeum]
MTLKTAGVVIFISLTLTCGVRGQDDDSLASSFFSGLFNSLTNTAEAADCPGVCVHARATLICDEVLEDFQCPTASMRCCVNGPLNSTETSSENDIEGSMPTSTEKPITVSYPATTTLSTTTTFATTTTSPSATSTAVTTVIQREPEKPSRTRTNEDSGGDKTTKITVTTQRPEPPPQKPCTGECTSGFFALFCDNIDGEADCPDGGSCCISDPSIDKEQEIITTTSRPSTESLRGELPPCKGVCLLPMFSTFCEGSKTIVSGTSCDGGSICCEESTSSTPVPPTTTPPPSTESPQGELPPCKGLCTEPLFSIFCEKPSAIIFQTSTCEDGFICCEASDSSLEGQSRFYRRLKHRISAAKVNVPLMLGSYAGEGDYSISPTCSVAPWLLECRGMN